VCVAMYVAVCVAVCRNMISSSEVLIKLQCVTVYLAVCVAVCVLLCVLQCELQYAGTGFLLRRC